MRTGEVLQRGGASEVEDVNSTGGGGKPRLHAMEWALSLVGGAAWSALANKIERSLRETGRGLREGNVAVPAADRAAGTGGVLSLLGEWRIGCRRTGARGHVQQIVSHSMLGLLFLQGMVMDHDHLVVISLRHGKPLTVLIDLMRSKLEEGSVWGDVGNRSQESLFSGLIVQRDH